MDNQPKKLYRLRENRIIFGVCGGLGKYFEIDPILFRALFVLITFTPPGFGILLYIILAIIVPMEPGILTEINRKEKIKELGREMGERARSFAEEIKEGAQSFRKEFKEEDKEEKTEPEKQEREARLTSKRNIIAIIIIAIGLIMFLNQLFPIHWFKWNMIWPILIIFIGFYILSKKA